MVHVTERAKEVLLERKRSANINDPDMGLRLARSPRGCLGLFADRMKAGDQVVKHKDSTVLLVDAELSELIFAGRTVDCAHTGGRADLVLTTPGGRAPRQR
jgi:Fe-S cluster assembly iron-binding protein IscA